MNNNRYSFSIDEFYSPSQGYAPIYAWVWNGELTESGIDEQLSEMCRLGIRAFYIIPEPQSFRPVTMPTRMDPNYLTEAYFKYYRYTLEKAQEYGMKCWLYDEGGWPSGGACGKVLLKHPEYAKRSLHCYSKVYQAGEVYRKPSADTAAAFINHAEMIEEGFVFAQDTEVDLYESHASAWDAPGTPDYPDLTMKEATKAFLEITHEQYKAHLGEHFGKTVTAVFTDEPHAPVFPFREELCRMYEERYGESILPKLPMLAGKVKLTDDNNEIRRRWFDICSSAYCENFLMECKRWTNENGMKFTGHLGSEDDPYGCMYGAFFHVMRGLRCMDIPGVDAIWRQIFPGEKKAVMMGDVRAGTQADNRFFPRYASSAAAQIGGRQAMTESLGVYGFGVSYDQMRYVFGFQAIRGVTSMNLMIISYAREGYNMTQEAPGFSEIQACHRDLPVFNRYLERLSYVCSLGERICDTALYYPVADIWGELHAREIIGTYEALGRAMEACGIDFDIVDDDVILQSTHIADGIISMGNAKYRKIAIPKNCYLAPKVKEALKRFEQGGGIVLSDAEALSPLHKLRGGNGMIRMMTRRVDGWDCICLFNESASRETFLVDIGGQNGSYLDITSGRINRIAAGDDGYAEITLESGETCALCLTDKIPTQSEKIYTEQENLSDHAFTFRKINQFVIGNLYPEYHELDEAPVEISLGDWSAITGRDFSGSAIYETYFVYAGGDALLDLGDVKYSCEVFLNGRSLGIRVMKPYRYEISADLLKKENLLQIRVSNTPGNQHQYTTSFDKYRPWQLSNYKNVQDIFDRDTLDSGLYGPITIRSEMKK